MKIHACLSIGRHPVSGRDRMAAGDRAALELALASGAEVVGLHAGDGPERVLRDYLGMGLTRMDVVDARDRDAVEVAARAILADTPDLVMCGPCAEAGEGTGLFPYLLAERLGWPLLSDVGGLCFERDRLRLLQVEKGGRRRVRTGSGHVVLAAASGATHPRLPSFAAARSGEIRRLASDAPVVAAPALDFRPARRRGARLRPGRGASAPTARTLTELGPSEAAHTIIEFLRGEGFLAPAPSQPTEKTQNA